MMMFTTILVFHSAFRQGVETVCRILQVYLSLEPLSKLFDIDPQGMICDPI